MNSKKPTRTYSEILQIALRIQDIELSLNNIPFNVFLKNTGDILTLCFIEDETEDFLIIVETTEKGSEELRIIPKINIEYISMCYNELEIEEESIDKMII